MRPEWVKFVEETVGGYVYCTCGEILQTFEQVRFHWEAGHFDIQELEEIEMAEECKSGRKSWASLTREINASLEQGIEIAAQIVGGVDVKDEKKPEPMGLGDRLHQDLSDGLTSANILVSLVVKIRDEFSTG